MGLICSAIVGFLCVQAPVMGTTTLSIEDAGVYIHKTVTFEAHGKPGKTWKISTGQSGEWAPPKINTAKLAQACIDKICVAYWRVCADAANPTKCSFTIDAGNGYAASYVFEASDTATLKNALANAGILAGKDRTPVPFAAMTQDAPAPTPPFLKSEGPVPF